MARLIDNSSVVETDQVVVAGLPVIDFVEAVGAEVEFFVMPRKEGGARLDRSFQVTDWLDW